MRVWTWIWLGRRRLELVVAARVRAAIRWRQAIRVRRAALSRRGRLGDARHRFVDPRARGPAQSAAGSLAGRRSIVQCRAAFARCRLREVEVGQPVDARRAPVRSDRAGSTSTSASFANCGPVAGRRSRFVRSSGRAGSTRSFTTQAVGAATAGDPGRVNWTGESWSASSCTCRAASSSHNVKRLEDGEPGTADRGNILTYEQWLKDRRAGQPTALEVRMDSQSILYRTLGLFIGCVRWRPSRHWYRVWL